MAKRTTLPVIINSRNDRSLAAGAGMVIQVEWRQQERIKNGLKTFGIFLGFTCFSVLMPVIHYVLVPLLFITTFVVAFDKYSQKLFLEGGKGTCPRCQKEVLIQKSKYNVRITETCALCHDDLEVLISEKSSTDEV